LTVATSLKGFEIGTKVQIVPYVKLEDFPHPKYAGRVGRVMGKQGNAFVVELMDGNMRKYLITSSVHLKAAD
jgi:large subunit ribosomal protein L21e